MDFRLLISVIFTGQIACQGLTPTCEEEDDELSACTDRLDTSRFSNLETMCGKIEEYLKCHHGVSISCPNNPLLQEESYRRSIESLKMQFNERCPRAVSDVLCEYNTLFSQFLPKCYPLINSIQPSIPIDILCSTSRQYLQCLERVNAPCVNYERNLDRTITLTKLQLQAQCPVDSRRNRGTRVETSSNVEEEPLQGDAPATEASPTASGEDKCSEKKVGSRTISCTRHILPTLGSVKLDSVHYCKYTRRYLRCVRKLMQRCRSARVHQPTIYDPFKSDMVQTCEVNSERCPFDVMEGELTILEYCVGDNFPTDVGGPEYCRMLQAVPKCLVKLKNRCQRREAVTWDSKWLSTIFMTSNRYCLGEANVEERSAQDMEKMADLSGQSHSDYAAINDGNEVNLLQSAVSALESMH